MRWIELLGALALAGAQQTVPQPAGPALPPVPAAQPAASARVEPRYAIVVDAAHGGSETGARLGDRLLEKDLVLGLSVRLRSTLAAHGMLVTTTRESDAAVSADERAGRANSAQAAACIALHATTSGSGVHLFTSALSPAPPASPAQPVRLLPWANAQSAYVTQSLRLASEIGGALSRGQIPVTVGRSTVQPMDSLTCPAVAVEVAPLAAGNVSGQTPLTDAEYQKRLIDGLTGALEQWRSDWRQQP